MISPFGPSQRLLDLTSALSDSPGRRPQYHPDWVNLKPLVLAYGPRENNERKAYINGSWVHLINPRSGLHRTVHDIAGKRQVYISKNIQFMESKDGKRHVLKQVEQLTAAQEFGIPYPVCYLRPDTYQSTANEGGFLVMEQMEKSITINWQKKNDHRLHWRGDKGIEFICIHTFASLDEKKGNRARFHPWKCDGGLQRKRKNH